MLACRHPDLMLMHIFELDDAQHEQGPFSTEAKAVLEAADRELAALLADLERSPEWSRTTVFVVSDHGFAPGDLVSKTLRNSAAQSSLRASMIAVGAGVIVVAGSAVGDEGTMRERQR